MNEQEFVKAMAMLVSNYSEDFPKQRAEVYYDLLKDLPVEAVMYSVKKIISEEPYTKIPTIGKIRQTALDMVTPDIPEVEDAWQEVRKAFISVGSYSYPTFSHPAVKQAVDTMGWETLCRSENQVADRAHFMQIYPTYKKRHQDEARELPEVKRYRLDQAMNRILEQPKAKELPAYKPKGMDD